MSETRTAAVVGAGIGGLSAAIALERAGYEATVYEQADEIRPLGAGLSVWPNGVRALRALGLDALVDNAEATISTGSIRRADGSALARFDPDVMAKRWGERLLGFHRAALHAALLAQIDPSRIVLGAKVEGLGAENRLEVAGDEVPADLIVGADGLNSAIRRSILGDGDPIDSGFVAYRGVAPWDWAVPDGEWWGERGVAGLLSLPDRRAYWYVAHRGDERPPESIARDYAHPVPQIVAATPPSEVLTHRLFDRDPVERWSRGNVVLLGDAAHPMLPFLGQGACAALEDSVALGKAIGSSKGVTGAIARYESVRVPQAKRLVLGSRQAAKVAMADSGLARRLRDFAIGHVPERARMRQLDRFVSGQG